MSIQTQFKNQVATKLEALSNDLVSVLQKLVQHNYPREVDSLSFEIFDDSFTSGFPVRVFFMDIDNSEHFISINGKPEYPSPVDPALLNINYVYPIELEEEFESIDSEFDAWSIASAELISWFSKCWLVAGGANFKLKASIAPHDSIKQFNLVSSEWQKL